MHIQDYSTAAMTSLLDGHEYGDISPQMMEHILGFVGESGEIAEKFKKILRDNKGKLTPENKAELIKELGDVLWYINALAHSLDSDLEDVAKKNLEKITSRKARGVTRGSGDNR